MSALAHSLLAATQVVLKSALCCPVRLVLQLFTQFILISLLWAPNSGGLSLMGDVAQVMVDQVKLILAGGSTATAAAPAVAAAAPLASLASNWQGVASSKAWLLSCLADGQSLMVVMTVLVVLPLSCQKHMRSLESAAAVGMLVILALLAVLTVGALQAGLPAVVNGQLPLWSLQVGKNAPGLDVCLVSTGSASMRLLAAAAWAALTALGLAAVLGTTRASMLCACCCCRCCHSQVNDQLPEAFSLLGYAFYLQPLIMPIIREMPEGRAGRQALTTAVHTSLLGE
jgi:hypothetical protein